MIPSASNRTGRRSGFAITSLTIGFIGILSILLLWLGQATITDRNIRDIKLSETLTKIELGVSLAHVWLEEALQGDADIDMKKDVLQPIIEATDRAVELQQALGRQFEGDAAVTARLARLTTHLETLQRIVPERQVLGAKSGAGSLLDLQFDAAFNSLLADTELLRQSVADTIPENRRRSRRWLFAIIGLWLSALVVALLTLLAQHRRLQQAHAAALFGERRLSAILSSIGEGIVAIDGVGNIAFLNRVASSITGVDEQRALGRSIKCVGPAVGEVERPLTAFASGPRSPGQVMEVGEVTITNKQNEQRIIERAWAPMRDPRGQHEGAVIVLRDVTERRRNDQAMRNQEAQLNQAQKLDAVGRLAGGVAHDINNYLGAIGAHCGVLRMTHRDDAEVTDTTQQISEIVSHASEFLRRLLVFSQEHAHAPVPTDINRVIEAVLRMVGSVIPATVTIARELEPQECIAALDPSLFEQVVVNLLVNARDALPDGGVIAIRTRHLNIPPHEAPRGIAQNWVELTISDNGTGIPDAIKSQILEPFFTTKRKKGSSGLGLSTVNSAVTQAHGSMQIDSQVGQGTTVTIRLPRIVAERHSPEALPAAGKVSHGAGLHILLVEDNEVMRDSLGGLLIALGHTVTAAADGDIGLRSYFTGGPFDLVVTDLVMPNCSGRKMAEQLWCYSPGTKVLFMSGYSETDQVSDLLEDHTAAFLQKPFDECALCSAIESLR